MEKRRAKIVNGKIVMQRQKKDRLKFSADDPNHPRHEQHNIIKELCKSFPECFDMRVKKPLKINISNDLKEWAIKRGFTRKQITAAIQYYVSGKGYLLSVISGAKRTDLTGNIVGEPTQSNIDYSRKRLADLDKKEQEK